LNEGWINVVPINVFWFHFRLRIWKVQQKKKELEMWIWKEKRVKKKICECNGWRKYCCLREICVNKNLEWTNEAELCGLYSVTCDYVTFEAS
jgi:hypothetical protein